MVRRSTSTWLLHMALFVFVGLTVFALTWIIANALLGNAP